MSMNQIQFQPGLSMPKLIQQYGTETQCEADLVQAHWPKGFCCPKFHHDSHCALHSKKRLPLQCNACNQQSPLIAGTLFKDTNRPLTIWFLAIYFIKTSLSSLALKRHLGISAAGYQHIPVIAGDRKPNELPELTWVNTVPGNVKTCLNGAYHVFDFSKYTHRYLAAIAYRFNRQFILKTLPERIFIAAFVTRSLSENRNRREGKPFRVSFSVHLRRIVALFNENERRKWPKGLFCSRFSILGQAPRPCLRLAEDSC